MTTKKQVLLLDMDNVLLTPLGYRRALQQAVAAISGALGYQAPDFSDKVIEEIEASGVTSEWEMAAITAASMMAKTQRDGPSLPSELPLTQESDHLPTPPEILSTFKQLAELDHDRSPLDRAEEILLGNKPEIDPGRADEIRWILRRARTVDSVIFRTIQELVLGSSAFVHSYQLPASLDTQSYLDRFDQPSLSPELAEFLRGWRRAEDREAVIFTNRPSTPPDGHQDTPEAEIGARLVGLEGVPILGSGDLGWLAKMSGQRPDTFLKPSAVHALSALLLAVGEPKDQAMKAAWALVHDGEKDSTEWQTLDSADVMIFEDSARGLRAGLNAKNHLERVGVELDLKLIGISQHPAKIAELKTVGATIFQDVNSALRECLMK